MIDPDVTQFSMTKECNSLQGYIRLDNRDGEHSIVNRKQIRTARSFFKLPEVKPKALQRE